jgi:hypothetical protein
MTTSKDAITIAHKKSPAAGLIQTAGRHELLMVA